MYLTAHGKQTTPGSICLEIKLFYCPGTLVIAKILALTFDMELTYRPFELELKHPFTIAKFSRTSTPLMLLQIEHEGYTGYGEASMVPYMGESQQTAADFLNKVDVSQFKYP